MRMINDVAKGVMAESMAKRTIFTRGRIHLNDLPITTEEIYPENPNIRLTNFYYYIKYAPKPIGAKGMENPFVIVADILLPVGKLRFANWEDLNKKREENLALDWIFRNTYIKEEVLEIARENIDLPIQCGFDVVAYQHKIKDIAAKQYDGIEKFSIFRTPLENAIEWERYKFYLETKKKGASKLV